MLRRISLALLLLLGGASSSRADRLLLWGIQRDCQVDRALTEAVRQHLTSTTTIVDDLEAAAGAASPQDAAAAVSQSCPDAPTRILGGTVETLPRHTRYRLWLHDGRTGQTLVTDQFCEKDSSCKFEEMLGRDALFLIGERSTGRPFTEEPTMCRTAATPAAPAVPRSDRLFVVVYGEGKHKPSLWPSLRTLLSQQGRQPVLASTESKTYGFGDLKKILASDPRSQVLGIELTAEKATLWVFDGPTEQMKQAGTACDGCARDELVNKIATEAAILLSGCFDERCKQDQKGATLPPPAEVCAPWKALQCGAVTGGAAATTGGATGIGPKLAQGGLWGLFGASTLTAIGFFTAGALTSVETPDYELRQGVHNRMGWLSAGVAAVSLAFAIPTTIAFRRAQPASGRSALPKGQSLKCPK